LKSSMPSSPHGLAQTLCFNGSARSDVMAN
jgi:hypothetical protein